MANLIKKEFQKNWVLIMKMQKYADEINIFLYPVQLKARLFVPF